jgi:hypothetical protein
MKVYKTYLEKWQSLEFYLHEGRLISVNDINNPATQTNYLWTKEFEYSHIGNPPPNRIPVCSIKVKTKQIDDYFKINFSKHYFYYISQHNKLNYNMHLFIKNWENEISEVALICYSGIGELIDLTLQEYIEKHMKLTSIA